MPELPEVEHAARVLRAAIVGRRLERVELFHASLRRRLPDGAARLSGRPVLAVERRGKHQLVRLGPPAVAGVVRPGGPAAGDGLTLHVHFRMAGDWALLPDESLPLPRHTRAVLVLDDGSRVALVDPRALSTMELLAADAAPPGLGPDATDPSVRVAYLASALAARRQPIKAALLDQRILAGVGNIYAAEALWLARIDPRTPASRLGPARLARLLDAVREALARGAQVADRYGEPGSAGAFNVYGRAGDPCRRCGARIRRIVQAGRGTWYCPRCQR